MWDSRDHAEAVTTRLDAIMAQSMVSVVVVGGPATTVEIVHATGS